jgi:predicted RND superfamily exporter protein
MIELFIFRRSGWILSAFAVLTLFFGWHLLGLRIDPSNEKMLPREDPAYRYLQDFRRIFGSDEFIVAAFRLDAPAGPKALEKIENFAQVIRRISNVRTVQSPLRPSGEMEEVIDEEDARRILSRNPAFAGVLASPDFRSFALIIWIEQLDGNRAYRSRIVDALRTLAVSHAAPVREIHIAGIPVEKNDISAYVRADQGRIIPLMFALIAAIIYGIFRRVAAALLALGLVGCALVWTLGLLALFGKELNTVSSLISPVVIIVTLGGAIHFLSHFARLAAEGQTSGPAMRNALRIVISPCFLAALTTAGGLLATAALGVPAVREFALFAAAGVMISFLLSITVFPLLAVLIAHRGAGFRVSSGPSLLNRPLDWAARAVTRRPVVVVIVSLLGTVAAVSGIPRLAVDTDIIRTLRPAAPLRRATEFIDRRMGGVNSIEIMIRAVGSGKVVDRSSLQKVAALQNFLESHPSVTKTFSVVDGLIHASGSPPGGKRLAIPAGAEGKLLYASLTSVSTPRGRRMKRWINGDFTWLRVAARLKSTGTAELQRFQKDIREFAEKYMGGLQVQMTGNTLLLSNMSTVMVSKQLRGLFLAAAFVLSAIGVLFRSFRVMALSVIPNAIPIASVFGLMGWLGIPLNVPSAMIASVSMGLVVDGTIHFLYTLRSLREDGGSEEEAVLRTIQIAGKPIMFASMILAGGFWVGIIGNFIPVVYFSIFTGVTILVAVLCDLLFLPAMILAGRLDWVMKRR